VNPFIELRYFVNQSRVLSTAENITDGRLNPMARRTANTYKFNHTLTPNNVTRGLWMMTVSSSLITALKISLLTNSLVRWVRGLDAVEHASRHK